MKTPLAPDDVTRFRELVRKRAGLVFPHSRTRDFERAVRIAVAETGLPDAGALYRLLSSGAHPAEPFDALITGLNVSETHFFRDKSQIEALERTILPEIIARRGPELRLRVWSAACSTGEEPYTLAILISQLLPDPARWDLRILATDVNGRSLEKARRGVYSHWSFRGVPPSVRDRYFQHDGARYEVAPDIRAMVTFEQMNLLDGVLPLPWRDSRGIDLILCRNALLYFDPQIARAVVERLRDSLDDHGWLLVSSVEATFGIFDGFQNDPSAVGVFRKPTPDRTQKVPTPEDGSVELGRQGPPPGAPAGAPSRSDVRPRHPSATRPAAVAPPPPIATQHPDVSPAYYEVIGMWRQGRSQDALQRLEAERARDHVAAPLYYLEGLIHLDLGRGDEALAAFRRCTFADPAFALGHLSQAVLLGRAGLQDRARAALENATRLVANLDPDGPVFTGEELSAGAVLELIDAQRRLLRARPNGKAAHG